MKIKLISAKLRASTSKGPFGCDAYFENGLNVIRAENTSGKSTLINSIIFALGLERIIGKPNRDSMKPVLITGGDYNNIEFQTHESYIDLTIQNNKNEAITIRRYIQGNKDPRLVHVTFLDQDHPEDLSKATSSDFYVNASGSATTTKGFHSFLAQFMGLNLPRVPKYHGGDSILYLECIAPLMFIEQVRGWTGIQATTPTMYGIKNVAKRAVEYLLYLDVGRNKAVRQTINDEATKIRDQWLITVESLNILANQLGGKILNVPHNPTASFDDLPYIAIYENETNTSDLNTFIVKLRQKLLDSNLEIQQCHPDQDKTASILVGQEQKLMSLQALCDKIDIEHNRENTEIKRLSEMLDFLESEIKTNRGIINLRKFGSDESQSIFRNVCPTCSQPIQDSLIPSMSNVMSPEDNLNFLISQREAVISLIKVSKTKISEYESKRTVYRDQLSTTRTSVRDIRLSLAGKQHLSTSAIRRTIGLEEKIKFSERTRDRIDELFFKIENLSYEWGQNREKHRQLESDLASESDKAKLKSLGNHFKTNMRRFGFRSIGINRIRISEDNYRPICEDFELSHGLSASDNIRLIWSYTLALLQSSTSYPTNHWGLIIFDEPDQQKMKDASTDELYQIISEINPNTTQSIIATSAPKEQTEIRLSRIEHNLIEYGDKVLVPL
ncbi:MAG: AAA family ATPase [Deltaproteobacteria bacterium]|nr:AAA family ATPase [Deltaproteobacteria bacterium]